ncbi:thioredoxin family protein [Mangrovibacterium marinum]|uniref:Thioredoxin-like protein n=1 Tax=Mangrovibacterium marinum TaxID=1639118 RepID=A0A2T5C2J1_9BACT|nr:thioredoxin family protein [Mangrovibacterium marinum]PTN08931.1 thioredoxin-like protein [Mangrovibacterium marinum]
MKKLFVLLFVAFALVGQAQLKPIYNPEADAQAQIDAAVSQASAEGKHVFLQIGGNWCVWCRRFHQFVHENDALNQYLNDNYVVVAVNYSKENKNEALLEKLAFPQRFGFPVFVVLDAKGHRIHTQNSAYLEADGGYDQDKVLGFFKQWSPAALDPKSYQK